MLWQAQERSNKRCALLGACSKRLLTHRRPSDSGTSIAYTQRRAAAPRLPRAAARCGESRLPSRAMGGKRKAAAAAGDDGAAGAGAPPRRSARVAAVVERATCALAPLSHALALAIFALLPVDARARAATVCRCWHAVLQDATLWARLDLSPGGVSCSVTPTALRGAAARAGGALQQLDVSGCERIAFEHVLAALEANAGALRELTLRNGWFANDTLLRCRREGLLTLLAAAPRLRALRTDAVARSVELAEPMLRKEGAFAPLALRELFVTVGPVAHAELLAFAADVARHRSLRELVLETAPLNVPGALDAVVDAALAAPLHRLRLWRCGLSPASAPSLARLLREGRALTLLNLNGGTELAAERRCGAHVCGRAARQRDAHLAARGHAGPVGRRSGGRCAAGRRHRPPEPGRAGRLLQCRPRGAPGGGGRGAGRAGGGQRARAARAGRLARRGAGAAGGRAAAQHAPAGAQLRPQRPQRRLPARAPGAGGACCGRAAQVLDTGERLKGVPHVRFLHSALCAGRQCATWCSRLQ